MDSRRASPFELLETSWVSRDISLEHEIRVSVLNLVPLTQTTRAKERIPHELPPPLYLLDDSSGCLSFCFQKSAEAQMLTCFVRCSGFDAGPSPGRRSRAGGELRTSEWGKHEPPRDLRDPYFRHGRDSG